MGSRQRVSLAEDADASWPDQKANDDEDDAGHDLPTDEVDDARDHQHDVLWVQPGYMRR